MEMENLYTANYTPNNNYHVKWITAATQNARKMPHVNVLDAKMVKMVWKWRMCMLIFFNMLNQQPANRFSYHFSFRFRDSNVCHIQISNKHFTSNIYAPSKRKGHPIWYEKHKLVIFIIAPKSVLHISSKCMEFKM